MKKNFKIIFMILAVACMIFALCACSCQAPDSETSTESSHEHDHSQNNQKPEEPKQPEKECVHYWYNVTVDRNTSATGSVILNGECWNCGDKLSKEVITLVDHDEWKAALSPEGMKSFTLNNSVTYTDYDEKGTMSWSITGESKIYTEQYFVNTKANSASYATDNFSGYKMMYSSFKYNEQSKTYVYEINDTSTVEMMFADGKLFLLTLGSGSSKTEYMYLNYDIASASVPQYFFDIYSAAITKENISSSSLSTEMVNKVSEFLTSLSFELPHEIYFLENGGLSVYFYTNSTTPDPFFGEEYEAVTVFARDEKIVSLTIGNNTIDIE